MSDNSDEASSNQSDSSLNMTTHAGRDNYWEVFWEGHDLNDHIFNSQAMSICQETVLWARFHYCSNCQNTPCVTLGHEEYIVQLMIDADSEDITPVNKAELVRQRILDDPIMGYNSQRDILECVLHKIDVHFSP